MSLNLFFFLKDLIIFLVELDNKLLLTECKAKLQPFVCSYCAWHALRLVSLPTRPIRTELTLLEHFVQCLSQDITLWTPRIDLKSINITSS